MANLVNFPSVEEQVRNNSGTIGFIIIGVGIIGIILGFYRLLMLELTSAKVRSQLKSNTPAKNTQPHQSNTQSPVRPTHPKHEAFGAYVAFLVPSATAR